MTIARCSPLLLASLLASTLLARDVRASDPPRFLIERLGQSSHVERERASEDLRAMGEDARSMLVDAAGHHDPEVVLRAAELLQELRLDDLWRPGLVTYSGADVPLSDVLDAVSEQTDNALLAGDAWSTFKDGHVTVSWDLTPFWVAVDDLCRLSGNRWTLHHDTNNPGVVLAEGFYADRPTAYGGPVRAVISSAIRSFREEINFDDDRRDLVHMFTMHVVMTWEQGLRVVANRSAPTVTAAVASTGEDLSSKPKLESWATSSRGPGSVVFTVEIQPPPVAATHLSRLVLSWGLVVVGHEAEVDVPLEGLPRTVEQDDAVLTVSADTELDKGVLVLTVRCRRNRAAPHPVDCQLSENTYELLDEDGSQMTRRSRSNSMVGGDVQTKLTYHVGKRKSRPPVLRVTYPRLRSRREVELTFTDVPLPTARPE